jgi:outer membrane protein OmpA-like peptidoglycan-associated protein
MFGCGPYRCPEEEPVVIEAEPTVVTEYVEKEELVLSMSYILFYASGKYFVTDASQDVIAQIEDEVLTWGEKVRQSGMKLSVEKFLVWGSVDGQPLSPNLYNTLKGNYTFSFTPPAYNAQTAQDEGNMMLSEARAMEMASHLKKLLADQGIKVDGQKEVGASKVVLAKKGEINPMARRVTIRVEVRGKEG